MSEELPTSNFDESLPPDNLHDTPVHKGRARERHRRRAERRQGEEQASPRGAHLNTGRSVKLEMPTVPVSLSQLKLAGYVVGGIILMIVVIAFLGSLKEEEPVSYPNALWIGTEWTYQVHDDAAVQELAAQLRDHQVGTVYAWISWLQPDDTWRGAENFGAVRQFAEQFKEIYPESKLYGWLSFPVNVGPNNYRLDNEDLQQNIADFSSRVVSELGFDGIFLNIEPVWDADENFLALLRKVRTSVGDDIPISVAIPPDWSPLDTDIPVPPLIVPGTVWAKEYKQSVALLSDQLAVMAYNSGLNSDAGFAPEDYSRWMAYQVTAFAEALGELGIGTEIMIGIPTYDDEPPGHDVTVETVPAAIDGVKLGLLEAGENAIQITGLAIYAGWTTEDLEWVQFRNGWVNR